MSIQTTEALPNAAPRDGLAGLWDRLVGPGMTRWETILVLGSGAAGAIYALMLLATAQAAVWRTALAALIAFDVIGGAVCNATITTAAWYGRLGYQPLSRFGFAAMHLPYVAVVAWIFRGPAFDLRYFEIAGGLVAISSAVVVLSSPRLRRPVAFAAWLASVFAVAGTVGLTPHLEWFFPALMLKLVIGHLASDGAPALRS